MRFRCSCVCFALALCFAAAWPTLLEQRNDTMPVSDNSKLMQSTPMN